MFSSKNGRWQCKSIWRNIRRPPKLSSYSPAREGAGLSTLARRNEAGNHKTGEGVVKLSHERKMGRLVVVRAGKRELSNSQSLSKGTSQLCACSKIYWQTTSHYIYNQALFRSQSKITFHLLGLAGPTAVLKWNEVSELVLARMVLLMDQSRSVLLLRSATAREFGELWRENVHARLGPFHLN